MFRRKKGPQEHDGEPVEQQDVDEQDVDELDVDELDEDAPPTPPRRPTGPWDVDDVPDDGIVRLDVGALRVPGVDGMEIQVNLDEASGAVIAVTVVSEGSALQLQPFAAPRNEGIWDDVRRELAAQITKDGGLADLGEDDLGRFVAAQLPFPQPGGTTALSAVRFLGVDGPRWFLRAVLSGPAAADAALAGPLREVFTGTVVVRGADPHAPREPLPLHLPDTVPVPEQEDGRPPLEFGGGPQITEIH